MLSRSSRAARDTLSLAIVALAVTVFTGCQDGPLYALKTANPYFVYNEWRSDSELGVTDHRRRVELLSLAESIDELPRDRQQFWAGHLKQVMENDPSSEMRRIAVNAAGNLTEADSTPVIRLGLDDTSEKVRMEACRALGNRTDDHAAGMLVAVVGSETNKDVRHAAMRALGNHRGAKAVDALRLALSHRDPATRDLAMDSLKSVTGKNYGDDPAVWIAALNGEPVDEQPTRIAGWIREFF
jgi:HEAT repeat protein